MTMKPLRDVIKERPWVGWALFGATMAVVFLLGLLASSIMERRAEALFVYKPQVRFEDWEPRNEIWGKNFPREYQTWLQTQETNFKSEFNGNGLNDALAADPAMVVLWAGYAFAKDYNQPRGHYYAVTDIRNTLRTGAPSATVTSPQPNTCWTCKGPDVPRVMARLGSAGAFYQGHWESLGAEIVNAVGCADCHDAKTMNLRISRPALVEAFQRQGRDVAKCTQQEMRSLVCAQCHVEYYFKGDGKYLAFPWDGGFSVEDMEKYYDNVKHVDWVHGLSRTPMLKAQHPDYELFLTSIHNKRGVSCADCHMPYLSEGGVKSTSHHVQSPLNQIAQTCQVCHRESEEELRQNVYDRQRKVHEVRLALEGALVRAHFEAKAAWEAGATEEEMAPVLALIRQAQWRWDFAAASHGGSFHAPLECARVIANGIGRANEARRLLARVLAAHGVAGEVALPDLSSKEKAQLAVGIDAAALKAEKQRFLDTVVPSWLARAKARERSYRVTSY